MTIEATLNDVPDLAEIRKRYAIERDKRLREDGTGQYLPVTGEYDRFSADPFTPRSERDPVTDHVQFTFVGAGFAGLLVGARLRDAGIDDVRIVDKAGDFGGTWYWNRYPGVMCDTSAMVYMPLLEEIGHVPTEKYAHGPEIREHCRRIARKYGLYDNALFQTTVTELEWDEDRRCWWVRTDRGDAFSSTFVGLGGGPFPAPKLPGVPGINSFKGHSFHSSRWDYGYTGGDPEGGAMERLADKRVALIGTGATTIQALPELAKTAARVYVFQRTPSSVDVRDNHPLDPEEIRRSLAPGWQQRMIDNFNEIWSGLSGAPVPPDLEDLVHDGFTELAQRLIRAFASVPMDRRTPELMKDVYDKSDTAKMNEIRARVDRLVQDPDAADMLKAWYGQLCKRPTFHDEYLDAFNRPNVQLVHTDGKGIEQITPDGVVANGQEFAVDCIIYASGFYFSPDFVSRTGYDLIGRGGRRLSEYWADGMRTLHGMHVHGFPNAFVCNMFQAAMQGANVPANYVDSAKTIAAVVRHAIASGAREVEAAEASEDAWVKMIVGAGSAFASGECTPGYYNNEGGDLSRLAQDFVGYPAGPAAFFRMMEEWRSTGTFEGLEFRGAEGQAHANPPSGRGGPSVVG